MAFDYGYDISQPAGTAQEAVQWLYFAYLAAVKEQNGAAMSLGRISTFLDIYLERDLERGLINEEAGPGTHRSIGNQAAPGAPPQNPGVQSALCRGSQLDH